MAVHVSQRRPDRSRPRRSVPPRRTLRVEPLEDRCLLSYSFQPIAFLGDPAPGPGGRTHEFDFEPGVLNERGQLIIGSDLSTGNEGIFLQEPNGRRVALARGGDTAPDGATYGPFFLGDTTLNRSGDGTFVFLREPLPDPFITGVNAGLYRVSGPNHNVTAALLPGVAAPGGGTFRGFGFRPVLNDAGTVAFVGIIPATIGPGAPAGLGLGIFLQDSHGHLSTVVRPGDPAPGNRTFDWAQNGWINNQGDVAFGAHVREDPCLQFGATFPATLTSIFCAESVYFRDGQTGAIRPIAVQGGPAPGGATFTYAFGPVLNDRGDIAFSGAFPAIPAGSGIDPGNNDNNIGVFIHRGGQNLTIARPPTATQPGTAMPGGGNLVTSSFFTIGLGLNNQGVVSFSAKLNTDVNGDGISDTGMYTWTRGTLALVARTGTVLPGVGTIKSLGPPALQGAPTPFGAGISINNRGQIVVQATLTDGRGVLLLATPTSGGGAPANIGDPGTSGPENDATWAAFWARDLEIPAGPVDANVLSTQAGLPAHGDPPQPWLGEPDADATPPGTWVRSASNRLRERWFAAVGDQQLDQVFVEDLILQRAGLPIGGRLRG